MTVLNAHFDGKVFVPDEPVHLKPNQKVRVTIDTDEAEPTPLPASKPRPVAGFAKHLGIRMSDDFNDPLDDFAEYE